MAKPLSLPVVLWSPPKSRRRGWMAVPEGGCLRWAGGVNSSGYGKLRIAGAYVHAHRWSYELMVGPIPEGHELRHVCGDRLCVDPAHLVVGPDQRLGSWRNRIVLRDGCWVWTGRRNRGGYGELSRRSRRVIAHRYVYELEVGPVPPGHHLHHVCENRACVNPAHLVPVTPKEHAAAHA